ncbi:olfactory receptor 52D1-like [Lissotriton helveticus]
MGDGQTLSKKIPATEGLKQGCVLAPLLFNLFLADLTGILDELNAHPPKLDDRHITNLLYADNAILLSHTKVGLQRLINGTLMYAKENGMVINETKTKIMVVTKNKKIRHKSKWYMEKTQLEQVDVYKYLGVLFDDKGGSLMDPNETHLPPPAIILAGFPGLESYYGWVGVPFCATYVVAFLGNCTMIYIIAFESTLHEPMYLFLSMLSVTDLILSSTILPKMLSILWFHGGRVTFDGCIIQAFFVHFYFLLESAILLSMAFDRYVAICQPLRYTAILTNKVIGKIGIVCITRSFVFVTPGIYFVKVLRYCGDNIIHHTYCENMVIAKLSCSDITPSSVYGLTAAFLSTGLDFIFIFISYVLILKAVFHLPSKDARLKALSTCAAHVCIILIFYILAFFSFFTHRFGKNIPPYIHILLANLYLVVPPMFNPVVYGAKTKPIRKRLYQLFQRRKTQNLKLLSIQAQMKIPFTQN